MSGDISVAGGAGGVEARYDDMLAVQARLDLTGDVLRDAGARARSVSVDGAVLEAVVLCPGEVAAVEDAAARAGWLPGSATWLGVELEVVSAVLTDAVELYRGADALLADLQDDLLAVGGIVLGPTLLAGGLAAGLVTFGSPAGPALLLTAYLERDRLLDGAMDTLYESPWLLEGLTRAAPGLVQGTALGVLGPWALLLSGGHWPTTDYGESVRGLQALAGLTGQLQDVGAPVIGWPHSVPPASLPEGRYVDSLLAAEWNTYGDPQIRVNQVVTEEHGQAYVVTIPGTEDWGLTHQGNYFDFTSNVQLMGRRDAQVQAAVEEAMRRAGIKPGDPVMLVGHSQGGIIAASIAADRDFDVRAVVTAGSPIARIPIPDDVQVLSFENRQDAVPKLDGRDNPASANWTTVTGDVEGTAAMRRDPSVGGAHGEEPYRQTATRADSAGALDDWKRRTGEFIPDSGTATTTFAVPIGTATPGG
ncbi:GPI inositol-deacylase [Nocardioides sp. TRM66260-LWL]|uniref:GPI inositol-deacylase n=1 Tax=Nocardioides sp. TRM66260-LWL TaxID=2874478 RepID=UPI001CC4F4D1|nr:GPI inositol-deacylase [Nocardioides sp. TRM66260-LWL]MBZ5734973.1 GPI inositol-deacylase [Nocardioides sp. TRM66260-LWL]